MGIKKKSLIETIKEKKRFLDIEISVLQEEKQALEEIIKLLENPSDIKSYRNKTIIDDRIVYMSDEQFASMIKRKDDQFKEQEETKRREIESIKLHEYNERKRLKLEEKKVKLEKEKLKKLEGLKK